ncbi:hypothetical protein [Ruegeria atlantica]|uniref:hypothetical protein n=1 Tax=Ruegeria atlantica TaxID=81569 RepID=UPI00249501B2|nr:hypothetical protein [Ruegeria atlantica]
MTDQHTVDQTTFILEMIQAGELSGVNRDTGRLLGAGPDYDDNHRGRPRSFMDDYILLTEVFPAMHLDDLSSAQKAALVHLIAHLDDKQYLALRTASHRSHYNLREMEYHEV